MAFVLAGALLVLLTSFAFGQAVLLDDGGSLDGWTLIVADGVHARMQEQDGAICLEYDYSAGAGYCVLRKAIDLPLTANYRFGLRVRGTGLANNLEFKLVDPSGENVWWSVRRGFVPPKGWEQLSWRRRHFSFAWGPSGGAELERLGAIEIAVSAVEGGRGRLCLDDLSFERLPDVEPEPVEPFARARAGDDGAWVDLGRVDADGAVPWEIDRSAGFHTLELSFPASVELSAVELKWADRAVPPVYRVEASLDGLSFHELARVPDSDGGLDVIFAPETEARVVRVIADDPGASAGLERVRFLPVEAVTDANALFGLLASRARGGAYPPYFGRLSPWTVIGLPGGDDEALLSAAGAVEPIKGGPSLEPFLVLDGRTVSWADVTLSQSLDEGFMPIPSVIWEADGLTLTATALATGTPDAPVALVRYAVTNRSDEARAVTLALAARPFQVLPAAQSLNIIGGVAAAQNMAATGETLRVDGRLFARASRSADGVVAGDEATGLLVDRLADAPRGGATEAATDAPFPSAALLFDLSLGPGQTRTVDVALPMRDDDSSTSAARRVGSFASALARERSRWRSLLSRTDLLVPSSQADLEQTLRANLAYILVNMDGPAIKPGSRSYDRSWIRDGSMTSQALIATGHAAEARAFIAWYAGYQYEDGKVPCVVDSRGPDPVDENDAPGEFLFAIERSAETGGADGLALAEALYPQVAATVSYIESMRATRLTLAFSQADDPIERAKAGLMPESISHEGYAAKPMHSYWDDFWVYRGLRSAAGIAAMLGEDEDQQRYEALADDFGRTLGDSVSLAASAHELNFVPGCVELGDFDATSTAIAYWPTDAAAVIDRGLVEATFERQWLETQRRMEGGNWDAMTPYEVRLVGTFVRLGWPARARAYWSWLMSLRSPVGWKQWGEVAYRERRPCRFVGDMPHTWVGSGAVLSILSLFAYEDGERLVLAGGVDPQWLDGGAAVGVQNMVTGFGPLSYTLERTDGSVVLTLDPGASPPGGFVIDAGALLPGSTESVRLTIGHSPSRVVGAGPVTLGGGVRRVVFEHLSP